MRSGKWSDLPMRLMQFVDRALYRLLAVLLAAMVVSVVWQVLSRYLFVVPAAWTEELARFLLIWIGLLGSAYAYRNGSHLGINLLPEKLEGQRRLLLLRAIHVVCFLFAATVLVVGGLALVAMTWELRQFSAAMGMPIAYVYSVIPISGFLICLFALLGIASDARERKP
jgi:TRAP-type C4-dicarboxylate transport system permease small subunit